MRTQYSAGLLVYSVPPWVCGFTDSALPWASENTPRGCVRRPWAASGRQARQTWFSQAVIYSRAEGESAPSPELHPASLLLATVLAEGEGPQVLSTTLVCS